MNGRTMINDIVHSIKIFILFLLDLLQRFKKFLKFIISNKHEVERICESNIDTYERTLQIDHWLSRTHCEPIQSFLQRHFDSNCLSSQSLLDATICSILSEHDNDEAKSQLSREANDYGNKFKTSYKSSNKFLPGDSRNLEEHDIALALALRETTNQLVELIVDAKDLHQSPARSRVRLRDSIYRILGYRLSIRIAEKLATTKYDGSKKSHTHKLISLWNELLDSDNETPLEEGDKHTKRDRAFPPELSYKISDSKQIVSSRWSHIGFQGEDPGTDFRGMGIWGLCQLEYLSRKPQRLARDLLVRSLNEKHSYPLAIVGINITYNQLNLMKEGVMKHFYFDTGDQLFRSYDRTLNVISTLNDLYVELFLRFDCFWHESKPENILEFKQLMENFIEVIKMDLCNRNFSLKFIY